MTLDEGQNSAIPRSPTGQFVKGGPGRPRGSRNKLNGQVLEALGNLTSLSVKVLRDNLGQGNLRAACYVLDRFLPEHRSIELQSPEPSAWSDLMANGECTPAEAQRAATALKVLSDAAEVKELQARLDALEQRFSLGGSAGS